MAFKFVCPICQGTLYKKQSTRKCDSCQKKILSINGCVDFTDVADGENLKEKKFYGEVYNREGNLYSEKRVAYNFD